MRINIRKLVWSVLMVEMHLTDHTCYCTLPHVDTNMFDYSTPTLPPFPSMSRCHRPSEARQQRYKSNEMQKYFYVNKVEQFAMDVTFSNNLQSKQFKIKTHSIYLCSNKPNSY